MSEKKQIRRKFRESVFQRDRYRCVCCGRPGIDRQGGEEWRKYHPKTPESQLFELDAHHIISRTIIENQGYVNENGISVCGECHLKCEEYWITGVAVPGFSPDELFALIGSSEEMAHEAAKKLK